MQICRDLASMPVWQIRGGQMVTLDAGCFLEASQEPGKTWPTAVSRKLALSFMCLSTQARQLQQGLIAVQLYPIRGRSGILLNRPVLWV